MFSKIVCGLGVLGCIVGCVNEIVNGDTKTAGVWAIAGIWAFNAFIRSF